MSWGFFVHLQVSVPDWTVIRKKKAADLGLPENWTGFDDPGLRATFGKPSAKPSIGRVLKILESDGGRVAIAPPAIEVLALLDRSQLDLVGHLAALMLVAGNGTLELVNDRTFHGDAGRRLTVRDGVLVGEPLPDDDALADAFAAVLYPPTAPVPVVPRAPPPVPTDPAIALRESFDLYKSGHTAEARDYLDRWLAAGREARPDLWHYFVAFVRFVPTPESLDRLEATYAAHPGLLREAGSLENAIAALNSNGRAAESVRLLLRAIEAGAVWTPAILTNTCHGAWVAADPDLARELLALLARLPRELADTADARRSMASVCFRAGDVNATFAALERAVAIDPTVRPAIEADEDWLPLHGDPRWSALFG